MSFVVQAFIWLVGIGTAIYIAVFSMFIGGLVETITAFVDLFKGTGEDVAVTMAWGIAKMIFASLTGWFIILATSLVSAVAGEYLD